MRHALDLKELAEEAPTVSETIEATEALVKLMLKRRELQLCCQKLSTKWETPD